MLIMSISRWYHGRMDRFQSEDRLRQTERHGSYLVGALLIAADIIHRHNDAAGAGE